MKAVLIIHEKFVYADGAIVEIKAWQVPKTPLRPEGYKYALVYIDVKGKRVLGYDNSKQQGHHKHVRGEKVSFSFVSIPDLLNRFLAEVKAIRGEP